jgi:hypothetical protein
VSTLAALRFPLRLDLVTRGAERLNIGGVIGPTERHGGDVIAHRRQFNPSGLLACDAERLLREQLVA